MRHTSSHRDTYLETHKLHTNTVEYACEHFPKSTYVAEKVAARVKEQLGSDGNVMLWNVRVLRALA